MINTINYPRRRPIAVSGLRACPFLMGGAFDAVAVIEFLTKLQKKWEVLIMPELLDTGCNCSKRPVKYSCLYYREYFKLTESNGLVTALPIKRKSRSLWLNLLGLPLASATVYKKPLPFYCPYVHQVIISIPATNQLNIRVQTFKLKSLNSNLLYGF